MVGFTECVFSCIMTLGPEPSRSRPYEAREPMPTTTPEHDKRIAEMVFSSVYPHYVTKVEKKGRIFFPDFCKLVLRKYREENKEVLNQALFKVSTPLV